MKVLRYLSNIKAKQWLQTLATVCLVFCLLISAVLAYAEDPGDPTAEPTATETETATPVPADTDTPEPLPTNTPTPIPTDTPTATPEPTPTSTTEPAATPTPMPTDTPEPTATPEICTVDIAALWALPDDDAALAGTQIIPLDANERLVEFWLAAALPQNGSLTGLVTGQGQTINLSWEESDSGFSQALAAANASGLLSQNDSETIGAAVDAGTLRAFHVTLSITPASAEQQYSVHARASQSQTCPQSEAATWFIVAAAPAPVETPTDNPEPTTAGEETPVATATNDETGTPPPSAVPTPEETATDEVGNGTTTPAPDTTLTPTIEPTGEEETPTPEGSVTPGIETTTPEASTTPGTETITPEISGTPEEGTGTPTVVGTPSATPNPCAATSILAAWVLPDGDADTAGSQVMPIANASNILQVWVVVHSLNATAPSGRVANPDGAPVTDLSFAVVSEADTIAAVKQLALDAGLLSTAQDAVLEDEIAMHTAFFYLATLELTPQAKPGNYQVLAWLEFTDGCPKLEASAGFTYLQLVAYELDFSSVQFGTLEANQSGQVSGDDIFAANDGRPTIRNIGNVPFVLSLNFAPLQQENGSGSITDFTAKFQGEELNFVAGEGRTFSAFLAPEAAAALDFTAIVPAESNGGNYAGSLSLEIAEK